MHCINPPTADLRAADFVLDWSRQFDFSTTPRRVPAPDVWERELLPELLALPEKIGRRGLIQLKSTATLAAGLAFGYVFREVGRYHLAVEQITSGQPTTMWRTDEPPQADRVVPRFKTEIVAGTSAASDGVVIIRAMPNFALEMMRQEVLSYIAQSDRFSGPIEYDRAVVRAFLTDGFSRDDLKNLCIDHAELYPALNHLSEGAGKGRVVTDLITFAEHRMLLEVLLAAARDANPDRYAQVADRLRRPRYKALLTLDADFMAPDRPVESWEALPLARSSRRALTDFTARTQVRHLHVFLATPLALAVFLGYQWNALDRPVQVYEYVRGEAKYAPACVIGA
jgi:hypothetical protein